MAFEIRTQSYGQDAATNIKIELGYKTYFVLYRLGIACLLGVGIEYNGIEESYRIGIHSNRRMAAFVRKGIVLTLMLVSVY